MACAKEKSTKNTDKLVKVWRTNVGLTLGMLMNVDMINFINIVLKTQDLTYCVLYIIDALK